MLGKRFQRTISMAQIEPAASFNPNTEKSRAAAAAAISAATGAEPEQHTITQWEILKHAEEMMKMMMAAAPPMDRMVASAPPAVARMCGVGQGEVAILQHPQSSEGPAGFIPRVNFLDNCFFCKRRLKHERDIFIYRGDAAFCTEECRQRQIVKDEMRSVGASSKKGDATSETAVAA